MIRNHPPASDWAGLAGRWCLVLALLVFASCGSGPARAAESCLNPGQGPGVIPQFVLDEQALAGGTLIDLAGCWAVRWDVLAGAAPVAADQKFDGHPLPATWMEFREAAGRDPYDGVATYYIRLRLPENGPVPLALLVSRGTFSSFRFYANGQYIGGRGQVTPSADGWQADPRNLIVQLPQTGGDVLLSMDMANFGYPNAGPRGTISLGTLAAASNRQNLNDAINLTSAGMAFAVGVFYLVVFWVNPRVRSMGAFALFAFLVGGFQIGYAGWANLFWPDLPAAFYYRFLTSLLPISAWALMTAVLSQFPDETPPWAQTAANLIFGISVAAYALLPFGYGYRFGFVYAVFLLFFAGLIFRTVFRAWRAGRPEALAILLTLTAVAAIGMRDLYVTLATRITNPLSSPGLILLFVLWSALVARRVAGGLREAEAEAGKLGEINRLLEEKVADRTGTLIEARDAAERSRLEAVAANAAKSRFLAHMSHELRTPLNAIIGFAGILRQSAEKGVVEPAETARQASIIADSGGHLLALINDVLDLAKIEAGRVDARIEPLDLGEAVAGAVALLRAQAEARNITLIRMIPPDLPELLGDERLVRQIFINLLSNAVKYTLPGGRVTVKAAKVGTEIVIATEDTGVGMTPDEVRIALDPYSRIDSAIARESEGTGLGLPIAKGLAEVMGGSLSIISLKGEGTTVTLRLPVAPMAAQASTAAATATADALQALPPPGLKILVVEDNLPNRELVTRLLTAWGQVLAFAGDGVDAAAQASAHSYDVILMDLQLPVLSGYDAIIRIRAAEMASGRKPVPIIAVTAHAFAEDRQRALAAGANGFVTKPLDEPALAAAIVAALP